MDSLQEAFIHPPPPEPCEARFIMNARSLFHVFWTVDEKHLLIPLQGLEGPGPFLKTLIGFVSHIHLGCFEGE